MSCGTGEQVRTRHPERQPLTGTCAVSVCTAGWGGGKSCDVIDWSETQRCNTHTCPIDCVVSAWAAWEPCSKTCGGGITHRVRAITVQPKHGGKECPAEREPVSGFNKCNVHACSWAALPKCHERHVKCDVKRMSLTSKWHALKPSCAHSAIEEDSMCWGDADGCVKTKAAMGQKCHTADTAEERAQAARHVGEKFDTIIVQHDRKNMLQYGRFKCMQSATPGECTCKCNRHPPCCAQKNKLLSLPNLGAGQRYTGIGRPQECCNICTNHPECKAWEYDASESVCVLKKGTPQRSSFIDVPQGSGVETYAGVKGEFENCKWGGERVDVPVQKMFASRAAWRADGATPRITPAAASP
jgi:hypothetical protein